MLQPGELEFAIPDDTLSNDTTKAKNKQQLLFDLRLKLV